MPLTFAPPQGIAFPLDRPRRASVMKDRFGNGAIRSRTRMPRTLRRWRLVWSPALQELIDYVDGFFDRVRGPAEVFEWTLPDASLYHPRPSHAPTLGSTAGGALGARTYRVAYAWGNANGETQASPETSIALSANTLMQATVPEFPAGATFAAIYALEGPGTLLRQTTTITDSAGTFTESVGGLDAGAAASSTNQMQETVLVAFLDEEIAPTKRTANTHDLEIVLEERVVSG